jgi:hypothetical protein
MNCGYAPNMEMTLAIVFEQGEETRKQLFRNGACFNFLIFYVVRRATPADTKNDE